MRKGRETTSTIRSCDTLPSSSPGRAVPDKRQGGAPTGEDTQPTGRPPDTLIRHPRRPRRPRRPRNPMSAGEDYRDDGDGGAGTPSSPLPPPYRGGGTTAY